LSYCCVSSETVNEGPRLGDRHITESLTDKPGQGKGKSQISTLGQSVDKLWSYVKARARAAFAQLLRITNLTSHNVIICDVANSQLPTVVLVFGRT
jgi:hypothetical protein